MFFYKLSKRNKLPQRNIVFEDPTHLWKSSVNEYFEKTKLISNSSYQIWLLHIQNNLGNLMSKNSGERQIFKSPNQEK